MFYSRTGHSASLLLKSIVQNEYYDCNFKIFAFKLFSHELSVIDSN